MLWLFEHDGSAAASAFGGHEEFSQVNICPSGIRVNNFAYPRFLFGSHMPTLYFDKSTVLFRRAHRLRITVAIGL